MRYTGAAVRVVHTDTALPGYLRVVFPAVPDDAVPLTDAGTRFHHRALHRRLSSVPQGATVQDRQGTPGRRRHVSLLHLARRYTGILIKVIDTGKLHSCPWVHDPTQPNPTQWVDPTHGHSQINIQ